MDIRQATIEDLLGMQNANLLNLPENYTFKYCTSNLSSLRLPLQLFCSFDIFKLTQQTSTTP